MQRTPLAAARVYTVSLTVYTLAALLLTWPLLRHFTTHVPGDGIDDPSLVWNLWWIKARLIEQHKLDIFHVDWMFHPININLGFYTLTPLNGLLSTPLQTAFSLIIANNLLVLSSFILSGFGAYLLARQEIYTPHATDHTQQLAALFAGFVYAFASSKLFYVSLGQFNIASSQWVPFCALYLLRLSRATTWRSGLRHACLAGLFLTLQAWAELTYASFLIIFAGFVFIASFLTNPATPQRKMPHASRHTHHATRISSFALLALVFLIGITPFLWAMLPDLRNEGDFFASGGGFADTFSADLAGYLVPTRLHPLFGEWVTNLPFPNDKGQHIFLGYSLLFLALLGTFALLRRTQQRWQGGFWFVTTLFFGWMTLGAQLRWLGQPWPIPGPFELISRLPFFSGNRYPSRYSVMLMLSVAVLAGAGVLALLERIEQRKGRKEIESARDWKSSRRLQPRNRSTAQALTIALLALFLLEHLAIPLPLSDFRVPPIYTQLAAEPADFTVLELPTGWRNGARVLGKSDILIMMQQWYQTTHGKRRLGGNTSRNPPYKFQYFTNAPLIGDLIALMNAEPASNPATAEIARVVDRELPDLIARNQPLAGPVLHFLGVKYVTLHVEKAPPALQRFVTEALPLTLVDEWRGPDWSGAASTIRLYQVNTTDSPHWTVDLATPSGQLYLAEGWAPVGDQGVRYATRPCADLLLNRPEQGGQLTLHLHGVQQNATLSLNGQWLTKVAIPTPDNGVKIPITGGQPPTLLDRLQLCFDQRTPITALTPQAVWPIGTTGVSSNHSILVQSAGNDVGNFAKIWVDGIDVAPNQLGYNLVALDHRGVVQDRRAFNTLASPAEAQSMADWLQQWPAGTIIAGAVRDEAGSNLTENAVKALQTLGVTTDLRGRFRWSHAFLGVVGAASAAAVEDATLLQPATIYVGHPVDASAVYGGVGRIDFVANP